MLFKNYEYFLAIVQYKSISKAAEKLYISQPSLSKYLKRLEERLGVPLFTRDSSPLQLTNAGELYLEYVRDWALKEKRLQQDFSDLKNQTRGIVHMGITVWRSSIILPAVLPVFHQHYPKIQIKPYEGSHQYMAAMLEHEQTDFSVFHLPNNHKNVTFEHLCYERILFAVSKANPILQKLSLSDNISEIPKLSNQSFKLFAEEAFILLMPEQNLREITQNYMNKLQIVPNILLETSNIVTATNLVRANAGVTFVPGAVLQSTEQRQGLVFFQVDHPPLQWEVGFAYKTGRIPDKQARAFMNTIHDHFGSTYI